MTEADFEEVLRNERSAYAYPWTAGILGDCLASGYECWVAERPAAHPGRDRGSEIVGHGVLSAAVGEAHLLNLCIGRSYQGAGYGRVLADWMIERARVHAVGTVFLEVRLSNFVAAGLYASMGFREIGRRTGYYPSSTGYEDARVMALELVAEG